MNAGGAPPPIANPRDAPPWFRVGDDEIALLRDGAEAFPAMLAAIAGAEREILLEIYWVSPDRCGEAFRAALVRKAASGVTVRVVYDSIGSIGVGAPFWEPLRAAGGRVEEYHAVFPFSPEFRLERVEQRDHRKILVVDGALGFTGGVNLSAAWLPIDEGGEGWRDDMIAVRGPSASELRTLFYETWRRVTRTPRPSDVVPFSKRRTRPVWVMANAGRRRRGIRAEYIRRVSRATTSVDIANPYFVPDAGVRRALFRAVARGVHVRVLVPARGDVTIVQFAVEALFDQLLRHGVELYVMPGPILHAKTAIVDDAFTTVGSYNLDERSWRKNLEANVAVEDAAFARHVRAWFEYDLEHSIRVDASAWRERSYIRRGVEWIAGAMRKLW